MSESKEEEEETPSNNAVMIEEATEEEQMSADQIRKLANQHFAVQDYETALPLYEMAIELSRKEMQAEAFQKEDGEEEEDDWAVGGGIDVEDIEPPLVIHLCNRSACLFKMEMYYEAMADAKEAVEVSGGKNAKAYFRLARAQIALHIYTDAIETLEKGLTQIKQQQEEEEENHQYHYSHDAEEAEKNKKNLELQKKELLKLLELSKKRQVDKTKNPKRYKTPSKHTTPGIIKSIKAERRKPSIREFNLQQNKELGAGNFSRIIITNHKTTNETFALKIIEKKKCDSLAKRQHPNVYNEVKMERRILTERITPSSGTGHERIVRCYHAFQDYTCLYFLMDLHVVNGDLWSTMRLKDKMVGTHPSLIKIYISEILDALEHLHTHGVVHRDLKPENAILNERGHIILVDFGTAKDLIYTDLNGPEFVGTADFMSPEAVKGTSGENEVKDQKDKGIMGADHTTDLWALGACLYHLHVGITPFVSPSPYLTFLKIQRGNVYRPLAIADDDAWDLMNQLMKVNPKERLGADAFEVIPLEDNGGVDDADAGKNDDDDGEGVVKPSNKIVKHGNGYDVIRNHPYFSGIKSNDVAKERKDSGVDQANEPVPIPYLRDLCIRSCAELVRQDSLNLDIETDHPPGDGSSHDMLRLNKSDRRCIMHILDRQRILSEPRVYRRFFKKRQEWRLDRIRPESRDFVGLTQMLDRQGNLPSVDDDEGNQIVMPEPVKIMHLVNPLFVRELNEGCTDEDQRKEWKNQLKDSIRAINRIRPKAVWVTGFIDLSCRKLLAKINESIPVIVNDGSEFFSAWVSGAQGLFLRSSDFIDDGLSSSEKDKPPQDDEKKSSSSNINHGVGQLSWLRQELEQSRMSRHHVFVFVDCDPTSLPSHLIKRFAKGRTLCVFGVSPKFTYKVDNTYDGDGNVKSNEVSESEMSKNNDDKEEEDNVSVSSTESNEESVVHSMSIVGGMESGLHCITLADQAKFTWEKV